MLLIAILLILITISLFKEINYERHQMGLFITAKRHPEKHAPFRSYEDSGENTKEE